MSNGCGVSPERDWPEELLLERGTGKSREPAGQKACPTHKVGRSSQFLSFGFNRAPCRLKAELHTLAALFFRGGGRGSGGLEAGELPGGGFFAPDGLEEEVVVGHVAAGAFGLVD